MNDNNADPLSALAEGLINDISQHGHSARHAKNIECDTLHIDANEYENIVIGGELVTRGTIDNYEFTLCVDGDAPDELVAEIDSALADVKAEVEDNE
jgi:hypothetical protein